MRIHFYSGNRIEPWDYRNVFEKGIGGSETSAVELSIRLAARGHDVTSYTALPADQVDHVAYGVRWRDIDSADFSQGDLWIIYRQPSLGAKLPSDESVFTRSAVGHDRLAFDWGNSLERSEALRVLAREAFHSGKEVHVIPALMLLPESDHSWQEEQHAVYAKRLNDVGVPYTAIHPVTLFGGWAEAGRRKREVMERTGCTIMFDDQRGVLDAVEIAGLKAVSSLAPSAVRAWLVCQDVFYPDYRTEYAARFEKILALCPRHLQELATRDPANASRLVLSGNGINVQRIVETERDALPRIPHRLIWTSSPDRGLKELLDIFERAKEQVPQLEMHIFYGMDNIDKICGGDRRKAPWRDSWAQYDRAQAMPGVTWRGRIGQNALARELFQAGIWCYPTWFPETSCISSMEAQACGAIPITAPIWGTGHNVKHGIFVEGLPADRLVMTRYVDAVVCVASNPAAQEAMRVPMMAESRERLDWERVADQWEQWALSHDHVGT